MLTLSRSLTPDPVNDGVDFNVLRRQAREEGLQHERVEAILGHLIEALAWPEVRDQRGSHDMRTVMRLVRSMLVNLQTDKSEAWLSVSLARAALAQGDIAEASELLESAEAQTAARRRVRLY